MSSELDSIVDTTIKNLWETPTCIVSSETQKDFELTPGQEDLATYYGTANDERFSVLHWGTGTGKTIGAASHVKAWINRGVKIVYFMTIARDGPLLAQLKQDFSRVFEIGNEVYTLSPRKYDGGDLLFGEEGLLPQWQEKVTSAIASKTLSPLSDSLEFLEVRFKNGDGNVQTGLIVQIAPDGSCHVFTDFESMPDGDTKNAFFSLINSGQIADLLTGSSEENDDGAWERAFPSLTSRQTRNAKKVAQQRFRNELVEIRFTDFIRSKRFALVRGPLSRSEDALGFDSEQEDKSVVNGSDAFWFDVSSEERNVAQIRVVSYARLEVRMRMPNPDNNSVFHRWGRHIRGELSKTDEEFDKACVCVMDEFHALRKNETGYIQKPQLDNDDDDMGGTAPKKKMPDNVLLEIAMGGYSGATRLFCGLVRGNVVDADRKTSKGEDIPVILSRALTREEDGNFLMSKIIEKGEQIKQMLGKAQVPTDNFEKLLSTLSKVGVGEKEVAEVEAATLRMLGSPSSWRSLAAQNAVFGLARKIIPLVDESFVGKVGKTWEGDGFTEVGDNVRVRAATAAGLAAAFSYRRKGNCVHWLLMSATPFGNMVEDTVALVELMTAVSEATNTLREDGKVANLGAGRCESSRDEEVQNLVKGMRESILKLESLNNPAKIDSNVYFKNTTRAEEMLDFIWNFEHKALAGFQGNVHSNPKVSTALPLVNADRSFMYWQDGKTGELSVINALFGRQYEPLEFESEEKLSSRISTDGEAPTTWKHESKRLEIGDRSYDSSSGRAFKQQRLELRKTAKKIALGLEKASMELVHPLARGMELAGALVWHNADENQAHRPGPVLVWSDTREAFPSLEETLAYLSCEKSIALTPVTDQADAPEIDIGLLEKLQVLIDGSKELTPVSPLSYESGVYGPPRKANGEIKDVALRALVTFFDTSIFRVKLRSATVPVSIAERTRFLRVYNSESNRYGEIVAVLVATKAIATGVTLRNTHCQIFTSEPDDILEHQQMLGRIIRASPAPMVGGFYPPQTCSTSRPVVHCFGVHVRKEKNNTLANKIGQTNTYAVALINSARNVQSLVEKDTTDASTIVMWDAKEAKLGERPLISPGAPALTLRLPRPPVATLKLPTKNKTEQVLLLTVPMKNIAAASGTSGNKGADNFILLEEEGGYALTPRMAIHPKNIFGKDNPAVRILAGKQNRDDQWIVEERLLGKSNNPTLSNPDAVLNIIVKDELKDHHLLAVEVLSVVSADVHNFRVTSDDKGTVLKTATGSLVIWCAQPLSLNGKRDFKISFETKNQLKAKIAPERVLEAEPAAYELARRAPSRVRGQLSSTKRELLIELRSVQLSQVSVDVEARDDTQNINGILAKAGRKLTKNDPRKLGEALVALAAAQDYAYDTNTNTFSAFATTNRKIEIEDLVRATPLSDIARALGVSQFSNFKDFAFKTTKPFHAALMNGSQDMANVLSSDQLQKREDIIHLHQSLNLSSQNMVPIYIDPSGYRVAALEMLGNGLVLDYEKKSAQVPKKSGSDLRYVGPVLRLGGERLIRLQDNATRTFISVLTEQRKDERVIIINDDTASDSEVDWSRTLLGQDFNFQGYHVREQWDQWPADSDHSKISADIRGMFTSLLDKQQTTRQVNVFFNIVGYVLTQGNSSGINKVNDVNTSDKGTVDALVLQIENQVNNLEKNKITVFEVIFAPLDKSWWESINETSLLNVNNDLRTLRASNWKAQHALKWMYKPTSKVIKSKAFGTSKRALDVPAWLLPCGEGQDRGSEAMDIDSKMSDAKNDGDTGYSSNTRTKGGDAVMESGLEAEFQPVARRRPSPLYIKYMQKLIQSEVDELQTSLKENTSVGGPGPETTEQILSTAAAGANAWMNNSLTLVKIDFLQRLIGAYSDSMPNAPVPRVQETKKTASVPYRDSMLVGYARYAVLSADPLLTWLSAQKDNPVFDAYSPAQLRGEDVVAKWITFETNRKAGKRLDGKYFDSIKFNKFKK